MIAMFVLLSEIYKWTEVGLHKVIYKLLVTIYVLLVSLAEYSNFLNIWT